MSNPLNSARLASGPSRALKLPWRQDGVDIRPVGSDEIIANAGETEDAQAVALERAAFIVEAANNHHKLLEALNEINAMASVMMDIMTHEQLAQLPAEIQRRKLTATAVGLAS